MDSLPDELLERIVAFLEPPFSTSAPAPLKPNTALLDKTKNDSLSEKPMYRDLSSLARVHKRFNYIVTPVLYQHLTLRVGMVTQTHENLLRVVRGPTGAFIRAVSVIDPDPAAHSKMITPNYRNNLIFAFSNFLVHFFDALSAHSALECFQWNVFDTLVMPPLFMDFLPPNIQEFTLDQGRVIPVGIYTNLRKFVYRAHMLSCTSNSFYERRISRLLYLNFENLRYLQLQNVNLAVCFEFRLSCGTAYAIEETPAAAKSQGPTIASDSASSSDELTQLGMHSSMTLTSASSTSVLLSSSHSSSGNHSTSISVSPPTSPVSDTSVSLRAASSNTTPYPRTALANQFTDSPRSTSPSVCFVSSPRPLLPTRKPIVFRNLETACFTDIFTAASVSSFNGEWLIDLLNDHSSNKGLTIKYASRCVGKDAIFARQWGVLVPEPDDALGLNEQRLSDEELFRRAGWADAVKSGTWKGWNWEYSTVKGWTMTATNGQE
ncbi:hypothetical protein V1525DRAFT_21349 [Lipomyces kononenkoae]|uniref:Uncharacterized protein n=1 Tax=Lipomyces kononenkoae TaxID=34357 RepID=A0ACC3STP2_LIPKO